MPLSVSAVLPRVIPAQAEISRSGPPSRSHDDAGLCGHDGADRQDGKRRNRGKHAAAAVALLLAACSAQPDAPGAVTADEARQLNEAAAMLDANSVDANALDTTDDDTSNESAP